MSEITLTGKIIETFETEYINDKFRKRNVAIETSQNNFTQQILVEFIQAKTDLLDGFTEGDEVTISVNINGKKHNGRNGVRYFTTINGYKIFKNQ